MSVPFVWGSGGQQVDQRQIESRRALANALLMRSIDTSPVQHWTQGAARIAQAIAGMRQAQFADEDEKAGKQGLQASIAQMLGGEAAPTQVASLTSAQTPAAPRVAPDAATDVSAPRPAQPLANVQPMSTGGMQDNMKTAMGEFVQAFPEMQGRITSGYRDQQRNAAVGGASGSRHMQGDAIDFSVAGLPEARQQEIANWWRQRGAGGFGYYPHKGAMHVDFGAQRAWGPNYSRTSLGDTPQWFQSFAAMPANQQAAPVAPQAATPMAEKTLGAMVRNGLANQAAQAQASPPVQVAQAAGAAPQSSPAPAAAPQGGISQDRLRAAYNVLNSPFAGPADKAIAQTIIQKALTAETKDPLDARLKQLQVQQAEAQIGLTPLQRRQQEIAVQKGERELQGEGATPLTPEERTQIGVPEGQPAYKTRTGEIKFGPAGTKITNDLRQESAFGKATGEAIAKRFDEMATEGDAAAQNLDAINQLKALGTNIGTGGPAVIKAFLGKIGIKTEGISDIEAFNSLIDRLTPQQRVPGSGATSDFDAKMFKGALPTLINTPGGNAIIIDTMEKIVQNRMARGDIAIRAQLPKDDPDHLSQGQALREIRKLQVEAKKASDAVQNFGQPSRSTTPAPQNAPATSPANGGFRILKVE